MASMDHSVDITLKAVDKVSPALRRIKRRLWWMQYGGLVVYSLTLVLVALIVGCAFLLGRLSA